MQDHYQDTSLGLKNFMHSILKISYWSVLTNQLYVLQLQFFTTNAD
jgi:hypothetical protein